MRLVSAWLWLSMSMAYAATANVATGEPFRRIMYLTGQHDVVPTTKELVTDVTHVILAFMRSDIFNADEPLVEFPLFTTVDEVRQKFVPGTKVMVAIGGWGDTEGFERAARSDVSRKLWAGQVAAMAVAVGADGVDIDWEYPGGNRDDYKLVPNSEREWEIESFVLLLADLRTALGPDKILSAAVPGKECDLMAFTTLTVPRIIEQVNFLNIMTYDLMNRRDNFTQHHSGVGDSGEAIDRYISRGAPPDKLNLGFGYYAKWFMTLECNATAPLGCPTLLLEDPETGADTGRTGGFSWHDDIPEELVESFAHAQTKGSYAEDGSYSYWDPVEKRWWSFDTVGSIERKFSDVVGPRNLGGVFAWGLGEDAPKFEHFEATVKGVRSSRKSYGELGDRDEL
ncbi:hypothetical protein G7046_g2694 [Stylonectria norvegica]|nr:hypothetical protein G7046_g2694 [Stylonectria norvegica]